VGIATGYQKGFSKWELAISAAFGSIMRPVPKPNAMGQFSQHAPKVEAQQATEKTLNAAKKNLWDVMYGSGTYGLKNPSTAQAQKNIWEIFSPSVAAARSQSSAGLAPSFSKSFGAAVESFGGGLGLRAYFEHFNTAGPEPQPSGDSSGQPNQVP
jgi:hypothetical protein